MRGFCRCPAGAFKFVQFVSAIFAPFAANESAPSADEFDSSSCPPAGDRQHFPKNMLHGGAQLLHSASAFKS
jgi:hypothetical protein